MQPQSPVTPPDTRGIHTESAINETNTTVKSNKRMADRWMTQTRERVANNSKPKSEESSGDITMFNVSVSPIKQNENRFSLVSP